MRPCSASNVEPAMSVALRAPPYLVLDEGPLEGAPVERAHGLAVRWHADPDVGAVEGDLRVRVEVGGAPADSAAPRDAYRSVRSEFTTSAGRGTIEPRLLSLLAAGAATVQAWSLNAASSIEEAFGPEQATWHFEYELFPPLRSATGETLMLMALK